MQIAMQNWIADGLLVIAVLAYAIFLIRVSKPGSLRIRGRNDLAGSLRIYKSGSTTGRSPTDDNEKKKSKD